MISISNSLHASARSSARLLSSTRPRLISAAAIPQHYEYSPTSTKRTLDPQLNLSITYRALSSSTSRMAMERVHTDKAPAARGPYSQAVIAGNTIYVSGQVHFGLDGKLVEGSVTDKTRACCQSVKAIVEAAGSSMDKVVRATVWLTDINDFAEMNDEYAKHFISTPARTCIAVKSLPLGSTVEIEAIALK